MRRCPPVTIGVRRYTETYISGSPLNSYLQIPYFPCFFPCPTGNVSYVNFSSLWQLHLQAKLTFKKESKILHQILQYPVSLESGNLLLEQTKFPVFWQFFQIPCVFPDGIFMGHFPVFPCSGDPVTL